MRRSEDVVTIPDVHSGLRKTALTSPPATHRRESQTMSTKKQPSAKLARTISAFTANVTRHEEAAKQTKSKEDRSIYLARVAETKKRLAAFKKQHRVQ
jgi:hypothetical protein